jgi:hypothetical protein
MKKIIVIAMVVTIAGTGVSVAASAVHAVAAWTTSKTERMVIEDATVQLPAPERAALEREVRQAVLQFSALAYAAAEMEDSQAALTYDRVAGEYRRTLRALVDGVEIAGADCVGSGRVLTAQRFRRFDCLVVSEALPIPTTELGSAADDALPPVVQRDPRSVGPFVTWVQVRVTGPSSFTYQ